MKASTGEWDIRISPELTDLCKLGYRIVRIEDGANILNELSHLYEITPPEHIVWLTKKVAQMHNRPFRGTYGLYDAFSPTNHIIFIRHLGHLKTLFHEFYHHLDYMSYVVHGYRVYCSDDGAGFTHSFGWQYADLLYDAVRKEVNL